MGFFTQSELKKKTEVIVEVDQLKPDCMRCKLYNTCLSPKMPVSGEGKKKILLIGEMPGYKEDEYGVQMVGESGKFLKEELKDIGISLTRDCWKINAVACHATDAEGKSRAPTHTEIKCCYPNIERTIKELKPKVVVLLGSVAITSVFGENFSNRKVERWRNFQIPDEKFGCYFIPMFHPSMAIRNEKNKNFRELFFRDLKTINRCLKREYTPQIDHEKNVTILRDFKKVKGLLKRIIARKQRFAFDYEATGLKPYRTGHKIVTIALAVNAKKAYAFPYQYRSFWTDKEQRVIHDLWSQILSDPEIKKICHNAKFEDTWSAVFFGIRIRGLYWDSMIAQKILDNRGGAAGLKFQTFVRYGIRPYDESIAPFLKAKNGEFNDIERAPLKDLLIYNGLDCIFTFMLFKDQNPVLLKMKGLLRAYNFFMAGTHTMGSIQLNGISVNSEFYENADVELAQKIHERKSYLNEGREAKRFQDMFGRPINVNSNADLGKLFFEVLGKKPVYTSNGNYKTDKPTIESLNLPFVDKLLEMKKYEKVKGTYLAQFAREVCDGKIHPFFDLHIPVSYRSSSSMPNFQNIPKRDAEAKRITREGIVPFWDVLAEIDFSGAEVSTSASYHRDKNFINYLIDPSTDMHRDCYDMKTRILTESGFKFYHEIKDNEKIGQYNPDTDKIEFVVPIDRIYHNYHGDMYCIENKHFDTCTTAKHRMYLRRKYEDYSIVKAKDIKNIRYFSKVSADIDDFMYVHDFHFDAVFGEDTNSSKKYHDEFTIKSDDMFELLGYLITDEHFKKSKQGSYRINLSQIKEPNRSNMKSCIDRIKEYTDFKFHEEKDKWSMSNKEFCLWLCDKFGINKVNRKLPDFIKYAPIEQLKIFFNACMVGDGTWYKSGTSGRFHLVSTQLIDDFQFICMRLGYATSLYEFELKGNRKTQVYGINIRQMKESQLIIRDQLTVEKYSGKVFCFTVPSGLLVTQRNNKISIQGNCATDLWKLPKDMLERKDYTKEQKKLVKMIRFFAKNNWTFAQFYGDWFGSCGALLWENVVEAGLKLPNRKTVREHLEEQGIFELGEVGPDGPTPGSFLEHCKAVEKKMWEERFPEYTQWKQDINEFYQKYGFIETHFGFRFQGYMDWKQCCNYPIQGTSFHLLLFTLIQVNKFLKKNNYKSMIIGQIHDSIILDMPKEEVVAVTEGVRKIVAGLKDRFKWMVVPMEIEVELSKLKSEGGCFADMEEMNFDQIKETFGKY